MITIQKVDILSYRSILNISIRFDKTQKMVAICGENNVGKTNTLRAINLFFNPDEYDVNSDRPILKHAQGGSRIDPKISLELYNSKDEYFYNITRDFKEYEYNKNSGLSGEKYKRSSTGKTKLKNTGKKLNTVMISDFLSQIEFRYIESININIPELVEDLTNDIIDVEYEKTRMTNSKKELRDAYLNYTKGLQGILDVFSKDISETFESFRNNWSISFNVPKESETFRDLISNDIELQIDDKGCTQVDQKGSGLQRLSVILLQFEILKRLKKKKSIIICVDEPDIYLHEGLQRKLSEFFKQNSNRMQIIYTTHSKIFINEYDISNIVLLSNNIYPQYSARQKRNINVSETIRIDINDNDGHEKICEHLGIEKSTYELLDKHNIIVEGECDKKYLEKLSSYFGMSKVKIIPLNGVDNCENYLKLCESYYSNNATFKPKIKVILDNDIAGRSVLNKIEKNIKNNKYSNIDIKISTLPNFQGVSSNLSGTNHEIEDFIYPELLCYLVNKILSKIKLNNINSTDVISKISKPSFSASGILTLLEHEKNNVNPLDGNKISFTSSSAATSNLKNSFADMLNILGEKKMIRLIEECRIKYPKVEENLNKIFDFNNF